MEYKIKITDNYLLIVDESEIKEGDWFMANQGAHKCIRVEENTSCPFITLNNKGKEVGHFKTWKNNIIAHLPLNNSPILEGVPLLPSLEDERLMYKGGKEIRKVDLSEKHKELLEDEVEKLEMEYFIELEKRREVAKNFTGQVAGRHPDAFGHSEMIHMNRGYIEGYNKAKEKYEGEIEMYKNMCYELLKILEK